MGSTCYQSTVRCWSLHRTLKSVLKHFFFLFAYIAFAQGPRPERRPWHENKDEGMHQPAFWIHGEQYSKAYGLFLKIEWEANHAVLAEARSLSLNPKCVAGPCETGLLHFVVYIYASPFFSKELGGGVGTALVGWSRTHYACTWLYVKLVWVQRTFGLSRSSWSRGSSSVWSLLAVEAQDISETKHSL